MNRKAAFSTQETYNYKAFVYLRHSFRFREIYFFYRNQLNIRHMHNGYKFAIQKRCFQCRIKQAIRINFWAYRV